MTVLTNVSGCCPLAGAILLTILLSACGGPTDAPRDASADAKSADGGADLASASDVTAGRLAVALDCTDDSECASGFCADGVCCDAACDGTCQSCALTGKVGTCSAVANAQDDTCGGDSTCDSAGRCGKQLGSTCASPSDCASGNCVDGVCCGSASCGTCQSCAIPGSVGACAPVPKHIEDPDSSCSAPSACNGLGACQLGNGAACSAASDCVSQQCVDGVCCESACDGTCYSCDQEGSKGVCKPIDGAEDRSATFPCQDDHVCVLVGSAPACKIPDGLFCFESEECVNGSCLTSYRDIDGDGWGGRDAVRRCERAPQAGYVVKGGDCCELDRHAHPGVEAFSTLMDACDSYDWNCDGRVENETTCSNEYGSILCIGSSR
jgi:hypothetical protein